MSLFKQELNWKKAGLVIEPQAKLSWMQTHAMIPTPQRISSDEIKLYFSGRDKANVSHIGWARINLNQPDKVLEFSPQPVLSPGERGCFDDNGVTPSCIIQDRDHTLLYYIGWNPGFNVRMHLFGGLAYSTDGHHYQRYSRAPILERCQVNPFLNTAPFVLKEENRWLMFYVSGVEWLHKDLPRYNIQIAHSSNGREWQRKGEVAIDFKNADEMALARPWVIKDNDGIYKMWFSYKGSVEAGHSYQLGYAESLDGLKWHRKDNFSVPRPSPSGWDSEMIEYACVLPYKGKYLMYYNGNNYGANGIGLAIA